MEEKDAKLCVIGIKVTVEGGKSNEKTESGSVEYIMIS